MDENSDFSDWVELYNAGAVTVNLAGFHLSNDPDSLSKWTFPSKNIAAGQFLLVWCSGKNRTGSNLHTNFSNSSQGETIYLVDSGEVIIDNIAGVFLPADISYGRLPNGDLNLQLLSSPSPRISNNLATALNGLIYTAPIFNLQGGVYANAQTIELSHVDSTITIHYTLDGSDPKETDSVYTGPFTVQSRTGDTNTYSMIRTAYQVHSWLFDWRPPVGNVFKITPVRARAFKSGYAPGPINTQTYFIDLNMATRYGNLPLISIVSDPKNLFNDTTGIYVPGLSYQPGTFRANYYNPWSRPANIEMYMPTGQTAFNSNFKISINGQSSPSSPHKGINVNATSDYGTSKVNYPLFENTTGTAKYITSFDKVKFRAWGSDRAKALLRDAYCASFMTKTDMDIEAYRPVVVFIDGEYWGLQELRERNRDPEYYNEHYLINDKNPGIDLIEGGGNTATSGNANHWNAMINFINANPLLDSAAYAYVKTQMDVNSFTLNFMHSIYFSRSDWPDQNEAKWRPRTADGKWKWIQWDMDNTTAFYLNPWYDMFTQAINGNRGYGPSSLLVSLLASDEFKNNFINLFADWMNTEFLPPFAQNRVDEMKNVLAPYMQEMKERWDANYNWTAQTDSMKWWVNLRPQFCKQHILSHFSLTSTENLTLDVSDTAKGNIRVNTILLNENTTRITPQTFPWTGQYFTQVPVPVTAIAKPGYTFLYWLPGGDTNQTLSLNLTANTSLTAIFDTDPNYVYEATPVINELMSSNTSAVADNYGEYNDWIEIYNPNTDTLDLAGYYLTNTLVLPTQFKLAIGNDSTKIPGGGHLLIWMDRDVSQGALHSNFKLNSSGAFIALFSPNGQTLIDSIRFNAIATDVSYGRRYDGAADWKLFYPSTPAATNWTFTSEVILINEVQTINGSTYADNYNEYDQWIELYNLNTDTLDLAGWYLSNIDLNPKLFRFANGNDSTKIAPMSHMIIWADATPVQGVRHTNFTLGINPSCVTLSKPDVAFSDSVCYPLLSIDNSYGRTADGAATFMTFGRPTPDSINADLNISVEVIHGSVSITISPNPIHQGKVRISQPITFSLIDMYGRTLAHFKKTGEFDVSGMAKGLYLLKVDNGTVIRLIVQ